MTVSLTRLRLRSLRFLPGFAWYAHGSRQSMRASAGFLGGRLLADRHLTFWTVTLWTDESTLKQWRSSGAHARAMPSLKHWCDEASVARWSAPDGSLELPDWHTCHQHLVDMGRLSPVLHPSEAQQAGVSATAEPADRPSWVAIAPIQPKR